MPPSPLIRWVRGSVMALVVLTGGVSCDDDGDAPRGATPPPAAVTNVFPPNGSAGPSPTRVSVALDLQRDGGVALDSVRLSLDGRDITDRARRAGTDDQPQSRSELIYEIGAALPEGVHQLQVEYRGGGQRYRYSWEFTVRG